MNQLSVNLELQADCFAGIWAHSVSDAGSSAQRVDWFTRRFDNGDPLVCDTFG